MLCYWTDIIFFFEKSERQVHQSNHGGGVNPWFRAADRLEDDTRINRRIGREDERQMPEYRPILWVDPFAAWVDPFAAIIFISVYVPEIIWSWIFARFFLLGHEFPFGQWLTTVLWGCCPLLGVIIGMIWGIETAARKKVATIVS
jgi:hypothetical protein